MYIDKTIYYGRPENYAYRTETERMCYDFLDGLDVKYQRMDHEPTNTMEMCREVKNLLGLDICKNLFLTNRSGKELYLLVMPGDKPFKTSVVSKLIGTSRLSFATPEQMEKCLRTTPGSASILSLLFDKEKLVTLVIDRAVFNGDYYGCHPCKNTSSLKISTEDMINKIIPALDHMAIQIDIVYPENEQEPVENREK